MSDQPQLTSCIVCNGKVSINATSCPHCGEPNYCTDEAHPSRLVSTQDLLEVDGQVSDQPHTNKWSWGLRFNCAAFAILVLASLYMLSIYDNSGQSLVILILVGMMGVLLGSLINAIFVRNATRIQMKFIPPYSMAFNASATTSFLSYSVAILLALLLAQPSDFEVALNFFVIAANIIIAVPVYGKMILHPQTGPIGLLNGLFVNIMVYLLILFLVGLPLWLIYYVASSIMLSTIY